MKPVFAIALLLTPLAAGKEPTTIAGWPAEIEDIRFESAADHSQQPALFYNPKRDKAVPLLVGLHTWSGGYRQADSEAAYARWCIREGWAMVHPHFRGPNNTPEACGSDLAVQDILSAVAYAKKTVAIDPDRVYLIGVSGGGHMALLMAGRAPETWAGVSAWCGIADLAAWHADNTRHGKKTRYAEMIERACGGPPGTSPEIDQQYKHRSPITWLANAKTVSLDINAGITDGHNGSVPVSHSLRAFNAVAAAADRISDAEIAALAAQPKIPDSLRQTIDDPMFRSNPVLFRRASGNVRVTLFQGGHQILPDAALAWLARQKKGAAADWSLIQLQAGPAAKAADSGK